MSLRDNVSGLTVQGAATLEHTPTMEVTVDKLQSASTDLAIITFMFPVPLSLGGNQPLTVTVLAGEASRSRGQTQG